LIQRFFGRLDEESARSICRPQSYTIVPPASLPSYPLWQTSAKLTQRGAVVRAFITGHDTKGLRGSCDWKTLAEAGQVAAIYMGKKSARFIKGRLLMPRRRDIAVTVIENVSRPDQRVIATILGDLEPTMTNANLSGPALTFLGLASGGIGGRWEPSLRRPWQIPKISPQSSLQTALWR
jgi:uroporphyrin-III C-methyltransferase/precorrin-2 dehydrogenase/sirohydrochlorin ferrochelatase